MKINIGSKNPVKIKAVEQITYEYPILEGAKVVLRNVSSGVSSQPTCLGEIIKGARNRAERAFKNCKYSFGIESGLEVLPRKKQTYMDICVCSIYDGKRFSDGFSPGFEVPFEMAKLVFKDGLDLSQTTKRAGLTDKEDIGSKEGLIGILTKGRVTRLQYTKSAIRMAMIQIDFPKLYR